MYNKNHNRFKNFIKIIICVLNACCCEYNLINYVYIGRDKVTKLHRKSGSANKLVVNDNGKLVTIKQPSIIEISIIFKAIMANKKVVSTIFHYLEDV